MPVKTGRAEVTGRSYRKDTVCTDREDMICTVLVALLGKNAKKILRGRGIGIERGRQKGDDKKGGEAERKKKDAGRARG